MLDVQEIRKRLGSTLALDDCSLQVQSGERVALFGANGAGKSTLLKIIAGVLAPDHGAVYWRSQALTSGSTQVRQNIGYVPEAADPPPHLSVADLLHFVAAMKSTGPIERELVERLGLQECVDARISELSMGQRRRACLAAALTGDPELLILDEPSNGLDGESISGLAELLSESSTRTLLLATHDEEFAAKVATRRLHMREGRVLAAETQNDQQA